MDAKSRNIIAAVDNRTQSCDIRPFGTSHSHHHALLGYGSELFRQANLREKRELQANAHDASS